MSRQISDYSAWLIEKYQGVGPNWGSDTSSLGLDMTTKDGAVAGIVLGILYAFTVAPSVAERGLAYLRKAGALDVSFLAKEAARLPAGQSAARVVGEIVPELVRLLEEGYGRIPRLMAVSILHAAAKLHARFDGDPRTIYSRLDYQPEAVIRELASWGARLQIKSFWVCREMRLQGIWLNPDRTPISGSVCCVVDVQVRRALDHLQCLQAGATLLELSSAIWQSFGELYDYPLLWFARSHCAKHPVMLDCPLGSECPIQAAG